MTSDPYDRRMILIPAVPSSGTSAMAGVLSKLGVNMGNIHYPERDRMRGYEMYEDRDLWKWCGSDPDVIRKVGRLTGTELRLRAYVNHRIIKDPPGPIGVKLPGVFCDYDRDLSSLPVITIDIHRQFEKCIASDRKRLFTNGALDDCSDQEKYVLLKHRAADLGSCLAGKMTVLTVHEPAVSMSFDELLENKEEYVPKIAETLGLEPTEEMLADAITFLDKDKKSI